MSEGRKLAAVIWDYDGTLVDSREKNRWVTRHIVGQVTGREPDVFPALRSLAAYDAATRKTVNWRVLYRDVLGLSEEETAHAGVLWSSQNSRALIRRALAESDLDGFFHFVVGYEEVAHARQKPAPDGLLMCVEQLGVSGPASILFVGDHEGDMECAWSVRGTPICGSGSEGRTSRCSGSRHCGADTPMRRDGVSRLRIEQIG